MRSCGRRERRDGGGRGGGQSGETSGEGPGEESGGRGREKKGKIVEEKFTWGGGSKERRGLFRARCAALRRQIAGSGLPFTSGFVCFVLGFWLFFLLPSFGRGCICCALCALLGFLFPFFFFPFLPSTPLFIYYIYFLARVRLFLFRIARVLTPHLRV